MNTAISGRSPFCRTVTFFYFVFYSFLLTIILNFSIVTTERGCVVFLSLRFRFDCSAVLPASFTFGEPKQ